MRRLAVIAAAGVLALTLTGCHAPGAPLMTKAEPENRWTELEWATFACEYGSAMFYVARDFTADEAVEMAWDDCAMYLRELGEDQFISDYSPYYGESSDEPQAGVDSDES